MDATVEAPHVTAPVDDRPDAEAVGSALERLGDVRTELKTLVIGHDPVIDMSLVGMLARQHMLQLGPPGTAKTMLMDLLAQRLIGSDGAPVRTFKKLLGKFTQVEELLGPLDLDALKAGRFQHLIDGSLATAHFVHLDEVYKASTAILNTMLLAMNERQIDIGVNNRIDIPLLMMFLASNEGPGDVDALQAFHDRIPIRMTLEYLERAEFASMLTLIAKQTQAGIGVQQGHWRVGPRAVLTMDELTVLQRAVSYILLEPPILDALVRLRTKLLESGIVASDRRWGQQLSLLRAHALLNGRYKVEDDDLPAMVHSLGEKPSQKPIILKEILRVSNPASAKVSEIQAAAREAYEGFKTQYGKLANEQERVTLVADVLAKLKASRVDLTKLRDEATVQKHEQAVAKAVAALDMVKTWIQECGSILAGV